MLPKDVMIELVLEYDLSSITKFCQTSKRMNDIICNNDNFWLKKLYKDFKTVGNISTAKRYYMEIISFINKHPSPNELLFSAISQNRLDIVKISLNRGADINYDVNGETPLIRALFRNFQEIFEYLLDRGAINNADTAIKNIGPIINKIQVSLLDEKIKLIRIVYLKIFPKLYKMPGFSKLFWNATIGLLEREKDIFADVYDEQIQILTKLAEAND